MYKKNMYKAIVAFAVAMAFVMPGAAAFANVGTIGVTSNNEITGAIENIVETNSDTSDNTEDTIVAEETIDNAIIVETNSDTSDNTEDTIVAEETIDNAIIVETNSDTSHNTEDTIVAEETIDNAMPTLMPLTGNIIYVDDDADPSWYNETQVKTIQEGINNATAGDMVYVYNGTYYENVVVNKQLDLVGESKENTIIDGSGGDIVCVTATDVSIDTFTITDGDYGIYITSSYSNCNITNCNISETSSRGIYFYPSNNNKITDCDISDGYYGIYIRGSADNSIINCNVYDNSNTGIYLRDSPNSNILDCDAYNNDGDGIYIYDDNSLNNNITNCNAYNNDGNGISLRYTGDNSIIANCSVYNNTELGIYVYQSLNSKITDCDIHNNGEYGIYVYKYADNTDITNCNIHNNTDYGIYVYYSSNNINITNCSVYDNDDEYNIYIHDSSNNKLRDNTMYGSLYNFYVYWTDMSHLSHDIDTSNTINGKPMYYLVGESDSVLNVNNIGYLALISCTNIKITAENSDMTGTSLMLINTSYSTIFNVSSHNCSQQGIYLHTSSNNNITNCDTYDNPVHGIYVYYSSNNNFTGCDVYNSWYGIWMQYSYDNNFTGSNLYNNVYCGIMLKSPSEGNTFTSCNATGSTSGGGGVGIWVRGSNNFFIDSNASNNRCGIKVDDSGDNNNFAGCKAFDNTNGFEIYRLDNIITNCTVYNNGRNGILLNNALNTIMRDTKTYNNTHDFTVTNKFVHDIDTTNTINGKPIYYLVGESDVTLNETSNAGYIGLVSCTNMTAENLDVSGIVVAEGTTDSTISNVDSHCQFALQLRDVTNITFENCDFYGSEYGCRIRESSNNSFVECNFYDNSDLGIWLYNAPSNNFVGCNIYNNTAYGIIFATNAAYNTITDCNFFDNPGYGINIHSSSNDNQLYHNNFINNNENAFDGGSNNWDDGVGEGNYWDDYDGSDADGDGIGDTPYNISGGSNQDLYPFMEPYGWELDYISPEITDVTHARSDPLDTELGFGWENFTCTVTDNVAIDEVKLVLTGDITTEYPMTKDGDDYYCNMTILTADEYTYHIWANDTSRNYNTSIPQPFDLPMNEDVDMSGKVHFMDLIAVARKYNDEGPDGWCREDVDNGGKVHFMDLIAIARLYNEEW